MSALILVFAIIATAAATALTIIAVSIRVDESRRTQAMEASVYASQAQAERVWWL